MPSFQIKQPGQLINLRFASAIILNHTPFSASGAWRAIMPRLKIDKIITRGSVLKTVPKATFFASTRLISFLLRQKMPSTVEPPNKDHQWLLSLVERLVLSRRLPSFPLISPFYTYIATSNQEQSIINNYM